MQTKQQKEIVDRYSCRFCQSKAKVSMSTKKINGAMQTEMKCLDCKGVQKLVFMIVK